MSVHSGPPTTPLLGLPGDCWVLILSNLPPREVIRARCISKQWYEVLTAPGICRRLLQLAFPQCREVRLDMLHYRLDDLPDVPHNLRVEIQCRAQSVEDWSKTIVAVARRYHNLRTGTPREYLKLPMPDMVDHTTLDDCMCHGTQPGHVCSDCRFKTAQCKQFFWMSVPVWPRNFEFREHSQEYHFPDPMWWYSQEDALLVYPASWLLDDETAAPLVNWSEMERKSASKDGNFGRRFNPSTSTCEDYFYRLFDPETGEHMSVPFDVRGRIIRRVRLAQGVLILEWIQIHADKTAIDGLEGKKNKKYRLWAKTYGRTWFEYLARNAHMATVFDVIRMPVSSHVERLPRRRWTWEVRLRYEWKLPAWGSGSPKEEREDVYDTSLYDYRPRVFSAHTATNYALLIWTQVVTENGRLDTNRQLYVWDISQAKQGCNKARRSGPTLIRRFLEDDMRHHQDAIIEAQFQPSLRNIAMDEHNVYLVHDDHRWATWDHSHSVLSTHAVLSHGIPVIPFPPARQGPASPSSDARNHVSRPVFGPQRVDICPSGNVGFVLVNDHLSDLDTDPGAFSKSVFCRHFVHGQHLATSQSSSFMSYAPYSSLPKTLLPSLRNLSYPWDGSDAATNPLHPRNFPGFAPCWRHENFPYIGISAVTDYAAGVRWVARDSRPLHILTPLLTPTVTVNISGASWPGDSAGGQVNLRDGDGNCDRWLYAQAALLNPAGPPPPNRGPQTFEEIRSRFLDDDYEYDENDFDPLTGYLDELRHPLKFKPEPRNIRSNEVEVGCPGFWENMMGRMTLAGDERWLIGQDSENHITLVRF
ncbi:hypothetical protein BR93DRAFT_292600 [Coniochaeta sp. PMI_546]|nr:hypothetical protein BR93DRAFT_292600 [Coniochaeta sp. PMI_546]